MVPRTANVPPAIGKYNGVDGLTKDPTNKARLTPTHNPGKTVGNKTPSDIPTRDEDKDNTYSTTIAKSSPTGTNNGSKKTYVRKPDNNPDRTPEKYRVSLFWFHSHSLFWIREREGDERQRTWNGGIRVRESTTVVSQVGRNTQ
jgi:hypothetical protein